MYLSMKLVITNQIQNICKNYLEKTKEMPDGVRQFMRRLIMFVLWLLDLESSQEILDTLLNIFIRRKYQKESDDIIIISMFKQFEVIVICQVIDHGLALGDEYASHTMHVKNMLNNTKQAI